MWSYDIIIIFMTYKIICLQEVRNAWFVEVLLILYGGSTQITCT